MDSIFATPVSEKTERELLLEMHDKLAAVEKRQKRRGLTVWIVAVALVAAIALLLAIFIPRYQAFKAQYDAVSQTVQQVNTALESVDLEGLTSAAEFLSSVDYAKLQELSTMLESLDTEKLTGQIDEVTGLIDQLGELNTEALVSSINTIVEKLKPLMSWLGR